MKILITGGAGFIGVKLTARLLANTQAEIAVLDNLHPQIHGENASFKSPDKRVSFFKMDIRDQKGVGQVVRDFAPTHVVHLAAETGTSQSMDEILRYCSVNVDGTAILIEELCKLPTKIKKFVLASSRAVYGEGPWQSADGAVYTPESRNDADMKAGVYEPKAGSLRMSHPLAASESAQTKPCSIYASTKLMQEYLLQQSNLKEAGFIFRFQNVFGPGQSLRNPYTGVLSIFCDQLLRGKVLDIYEDGEIVRDFVFVEDIVTGIEMALASDLANCEIVNLGSGKPTTILNAAKFLCELIGESPQEKIKISGRYRTGDIRHACANIDLAKEKIGWMPKHDVAAGLSLLVDWCKLEFRN